MDVVIVGEDQATRESLYRLINYVGDIIILYELCFIIVFPFKTNIFIFKITCVIISVFLSSIISLVFEKWTETYGNSYFGLGHKNE